MADKNKNTAKLRLLCLRAIEAEAAHEAAQAEERLNGHNPRDFGGNADDAYEAGEHAGKIMGEASLARAILGAS